MASKLEDLLYIHHWAFCLFSISLPQSQASDVPSFGVAKSPCITAIALCLPSSLMAFSGMNLANSAEVAVCSHDGSKAFRARARRVVAGLF